MIQIAQDRHALVRIDLTDLDDRPNPRGFSADTVNSYFCDAGVDVSLCWIGTKMFDKVMAQHRANFETPTQVNVRRIGDLTLGAAHVTEVVYWKSRPLPADEKGTLKNAQEATWQYLWPADNGANFGMLTVWRAGFDPCEALEDGFYGARSRWDVQLPRIGVLHDVASALDEQTLIVTGTFITVSDVAWGRIIPPTFADDSDWQITLNALPEVKPFELPLAMTASFDDVVNFVELWEPVFLSMKTHVANVVAATRGVLDADFTIEDIRFVDDDTIALEFTLATADRQKAQAWLFADGSYGSPEIW